jgi:hypothetical protein
VSALLNLVRLEELVLYNPKAHYCGKYSAVEDLGRCFHRIMPKLKIFGSEGFQDEDWSWGNTNQNQILHVQTHGHSSYNLEECLIENRLPLE